MCRIVSSTVWFRTCTGELVAIRVQDGDAVDCEVAQDILVFVGSLGELPDEVGHHGRRDPLPGVDSWNTDARITGSRHSVTS